MTAPGDSLQRVQERVSALLATIERVQSDLEFVDRGGVVVHMVDFSEVFAFLHPERDQAGLDELGIGPGDAADARAFRRLGLTHLFRTYGESLFLLPAHAIELQRFLAQHDAFQSRAAAVARAAQGWIEQLDERERASLERLQDSRVLSARERREVSELLRDEAVKLCDQVADLTGWQANDTAVGELTGLVKSGRLAHRVDPLLRARGLPMGLLDKPGRDDVAAVFQAFPPTSAARRASKLLDARALLHLRDLNRALAGQGVRVVLVTRDETLRVAVSALSRSSRFGWSQVGEHLRSLDDVLLDLLLRGVEEPLERAESLGETATMFREVASSLNAVEKRPPRDHSSAFRVEGMVRSKLYRFQERWRDHRHLRLTQALPHLPWLSTEFLPQNVVEEGEDDPTIPPGDRGAVGKMRRLVEFVSGADYQIQVRQDLLALRRELASQSLQMLFLGRISEERIEALVSSFAEGWSTADRDQGTLLRSTRYSLVCSVEFASEEFRERMAPLERWEPDEQARYERLERVFYDLIQHSMGASPDPEAFLFMSFVLATLRRWADAHELAHQALRVAEDGLRHEVHYLLAVCSRRLGTADLPDALAYLVAAYRQISMAGELAQERGRGADPRYQHEEGTIILQWHHLAGILGATAPAGGLHPGARTRGEAVELLRQALAGALRDGDARLEVDVRNNLAFAAATATPPDLDTARDEAACIRALFADPGRHPALPPAPRPALCDTLLFVDALTARERGDADGVRAALAGWEALRDDPNLLAHEQVAIDRAIARVRQWSLLADD